MVQESHPHADAADTDNYACTVVLRDTGLVLRRVPVMTARVGTVAVPEPGQLVLVAFVGGDLAAPVIVGCLYTDAHRPPVNAAGVHVTHLPPGADDAEAVHLELRSAGERSIVLTLGDGLALTLADADPAVSLDVGRQGHAHDRQGRHRRADLAGRGDPQGRGGHRRGPGRADAQGRHRGHQLTRRAGMGQPAAKQGDKVVATDIHIVNIPSPGGPVPTPLPHPFVAASTAASPPR